MNKHLIDWLIDCLIDWSFDWLDDWSFDWLDDWSIGWLNDWLIDQLIDWMIDWLINWLIVWLIDWLIDWLIEALKMSTMHQSCCINPAASVNLKTLQWISMWNIKALQLLLSFFFIPVSTNTFPMPDNTISPSWTSNNYSPDFTSNHFSSTLHHDDSTASIIHASTMRKRTSAGLHVNHKAHLGDGGPGVVLNGVIPKIGPSPKKMVIF